MMELETFLDVGQVAELLGLSTATIRKWVLIRYIPFKKMGRAVRFSVREVLKWADRRTINPADGQNMLVNANENSGGEG